MSLIIEKCSDPKKIGYISVLGVPILPEEVELLVSD